MKMGEAVTMYISYRMSLGEKARTISFIIKNFCNYIGAALFPLLECAWHQRRSCLHILVQYICGVEWILYMGSGQKIYGGKSFAKG